MQKAFSYFVFISLIFTSCTFVSELSTAIVEETKGISSDLKTKQYEKEKDSENWNTLELDTAKDIEYLTYIEKNVILEMNKVRSNPKKYAELYIETRLKNYSGKEYITGAGTIITEEGRKAVEECVNSLKRNSELGKLVPESSLYYLAKEHVDLQGPTGQTGHNSPSGDSFQKRASRFIDNTIRNYGENIAYGSTSAREIVVSLLIDDGVPSRGHRKNIMNGQFNVVGVCYGKHKKYGSMCVIDFGKR